MKGKKLLITIVNSENIFSSPTLRICLIESEFKLMFKFSFYYLRILTLLSFVVLTRRIQVMGWTWKYFPQYIDIPQFPCFFNHGPRLVIVRTIEHVHVSQQNQFWMAKHDHFPGLSLFHTIAKHAVFCPPRLSCTIVLTQ